VLLSGPEPSRTELENKLLQIISTSQKKVALVRGSKFKIQNSAFENSDVYDLPSKEELKKLILSSKQIICRSGYSTLMDMHVLEKKDLVLIPTPGQTEQEYLADHWKKKFGTHVIKQNEINKLINFVL
jgi:predicted glycosyltransferase